MQIDLAATLVTNYSEINATMAASPRIVAHDDPGCRWISSDIPAPAVNLVISGDLPDDVAEQQIIRVVTHFKVASLPFQWRVGAQTEVTGIEARLVAAGLPPGARWPVMGGRLKVVQQPLPPQRWLVGCGRCWWRPCCWQQRCEPGRWWQSLAGRSIASGVALPLTSHRFEGAAASHSVVPPRNSTITIHAQVGSEPCLTSHHDCCCIGFSSSLA